METKTKCYVLQQYHTKGDVHRASDIIGITSSETEAKDWVKNNDKNFYDETTISLDEAILQPIIDKACEKQRENCVNMLYKIIGANVDEGVNAMKGLGDIVDAPQPMLEELLERDESRLLVFPAREIRVGDKILNGEQIKQLVLEKEVRVSDVICKGKLCNATVKIEDGQIKKRFVLATSKQQQKPPATTTKRKTQPQKKGVKM